MIEIFTGLRPIRCQGDISNIIAAAGKDHHDVIAPTHVIEKNKEIVGYVSIAGLPMTICHFSTEGMQAEDSFAVINTMECILQNSGAKGVIAPIGKDSPFHKVLMNTKVGYRFLANVDLFVKTF